MALIFSALITAATAAQAPGSGTYDEMRRVVGELYQSQKYQEAAGLLAAALDRYPDHILANTYNLALMRVRLGEAEEATRALDLGHSRGIFYGKWAFEDAAWESLRKVEDFRRFLARNDGLILQAEKKAAMKLEVVTPPGYDQSRKYPLFIALHGGGENLAQFKPHWTSPVLRNEFLVAYVQSSQVASMDGFHWQRDAVTLKDLSQAYRDVLARYPVDPERVLIGGFSSGGYGTLITLFAEAFPLAGFVILCPEVPADPDNEAITRAARRGVRGTLLTTEFDRRIDHQREYAARLTKSGLEVRLIVTPNVGHWYPEDLERLIDEALAVYSWRSATSGSTREARQAGT